MGCVYKLGVCGSPSVFTGENVSVMHARATVHAGCGYVAAPGRSPNSSSSRCY
jgi:hypothetical protein